MNIAYCQNNYGSSCSEYGLAMSFREIMNWLQRKSKSHSTTKSYKPITRKDMATRKSELNTTEPKFWTNKGESEKVMQNNQRLCASYHCTKVLVDVLKESVDVQVEPN